MTDRRTVAVVATPDIAAPLGLGGTPEVTFAWRGLVVPGEQIGVFPVGPNGLTVTGFRGHLEHVPADPSVILTVKLRAIVVAGTLESVIAPAIADMNGVAADWNRLGLPAPSLDTGFGNPPPSLHVDAGTYMWLDTGIIPSHIEFDAYTPDLIDVVFAADTSGAGTLARVDCRGIVGGGYGPGLAPIASWTSWSAPSGEPKFAANTWHHAVIDVEGGVAAMTLDGTPVGTLAVGTGTTIGIVGDGGSGGHIGNLCVSYDAATIDLSQGAPSAEQTGLNAAFVEGNLLYVATVSPPYILDAFGLTVIAETS